MLTQLGPDSFYESLAPEVSPLPKLQLASCLSKYASNGDVKSGHYYIIAGESEVLDLDSSVDILPLARRPKALDTNTEPMTSVYDADTHEFNEIRQRAAEKDSGCMWGVSFLVVVASQYCEYYCGNKSSRKIAPDLARYLPLTQADIDARNLDAKPREPMPVTLRSELVERERFAWYVPVVAECSEWFGKLPDGVEGEVRQFVDP